MAGRTPPEPKRPFVLDFEPLRRYRKYHLLTQAALAQSAGVDRTTIFRLENNRLVNPSLPALVAISRSLGVPMYDLFIVRDIAA